MAARRISELLERVEASSTGNPMRHANVLGAADRAREVARKAPLVRRVTATAGATRTWRQSLADRTLDTVPPCTSIEQRAGIAGSIYCFLGAAAYPQGDVALLLNADIAEQAPSSFWPFDTGALEKGHLVRGTNQLTPSEREAAFLDDWGAAVEVRAFAASYLASHFTHPIDYCTREQSSEPDFPAYHGLQSSDGDRRAWTLEVQLHEAVQLADGNLQLIVVNKHQLLAEMPDELIGLTVVATDVGEAVGRELVRICTGDAA